MNCCKFIPYRDCTLEVREIIEDGFVYIYLLQRKDSIISHYVKYNNTQTVIFELPEDGLYYIGTIKITTKKNSEYYYQDGIFYYGELVIEIEDLLNNVPIKIEPYFNICQLKRCFTLIIMDIFNKDFPEKCQITSKSDKELLYKRDLIWMAINIILYLQEFKQFDEAERILDKIIGCNGLCPKIVKTGGCGCGCD